MREFRSTLPNLLHATNIKIIPATLIIGDYILTPDICVERKSIPDLISSLNTGRLSVLCFFFFFFFQWLTCNDTTRYTQCELMSLHYKQPILLIEFEENKAFSLKVSGDIFDSSRITGRTNSLQTVSEVKSFKKEDGKYPSKRQTENTRGCGSATVSVQSKLVLLTLSFPRLRIIWSSSPYATAEIFKDLKLNNHEPDVFKAAAMGGEDGMSVANNWNTGAEELLHSFPGMTDKNVRYVMGRVFNVQALCAMKVEQIQEVLGTEPGKICWDFIHHGE